MMADLESTPATAAAATVADPASTELTGAGLSWRPWLLGLASVIVILACYWPLALHGNSETLMAPGDLTSTARDYWAAAHLHKTPFTLVTDTTLDVPVGRPSAPAVQIANALEPSFVLVTHRLVGWLGALNLFLLVGVAASIGAMFLLLMRLRFHPLASFAGAVAFGSSQWSAEQLRYGHVAFCQLWVFPLLLGSLLYASRGRARRAIAPGGAFALSFYASSYLGLLATVATLAYLVALVWDRKRGVLKDLRRLAVGAFAATVFLLPVAFASRIAPSSRLNLPQVSRTDLFGARVRDYFIPSSHDVIYGAAVRSLYGPHVGEQVLFFGYGVMVLAVVASYMLLRRRIALNLVTRFALVCIPLGWFLALPAYERIGNLRVPVPGPAFVLGGEISWWRIYERIAVVVGFGLVILAVVTLDWLIRQRRRRAIVVACLAAAVMLVEALPGLPSSRVEMKPSPVAIWLRAHPGGAVVSYPFEMSQNAQAFGDYWWHWYYDQTYHQHPVFDHPATGIEPTALGLTPLLASDPSNPDTPPILRAVGVKWVVMRDAIFAATGVQEEPVARGLRLVASLPGARIFHVSAKPADIASVIRSNEVGLARAIASGDAGIDFASGFYGEETYGDYNAARWLRQDGELHIQPAVPRPFVVYKIEMNVFSHVVPRRLDVLDGNRVVGSFLVPPRETTLSISLPGTDSVLRLHASPGPKLLGGGDTRTGSIYIESVRASPISVILEPSVGDTP